MQKEIIGCIDCPMCLMNDMSIGYTCRIIDINSGQARYIEENEKFIPVTPMWCPIKAEPFTVKYKNNE